MTFGPRDAKNLSTTANCLEKIVRLLEAQHRNTMEVHRVLTEISAKLSKPETVKDSNQLEIYKLVTTQAMRYNDKYQPDDQGRLKPHEWRHNLGLETFFDVNAPCQESQQMTEDEFRAYDGGL